MITISLCMIIKNEEAVLSRCLENIKDLVDEIIIVDTGSTDNSKEIAKKYTSNVFDFEWIYDFSSARNFSFSLASMDYILWLDADDILLQKDRLKFINLKETLSTNIDAVIMKYNTWVDENNNPLISIKRERLVKRNNNFKWCEPVHEILNINGEILHSDLCITHKPEHERHNRNLTIFEKTLCKGMELSARSMYYYATELFYNQRYDDAIIFYEKFLSTNNESKSFYINSCTQLSNCYKLKKDTTSALNSLYRSFQYDIPTPLVCFDIGKCYKSQSQYNQAIFWLELCLNLTKTNSNDDYIINYNTKYLPCIELYNCYKYINDEINSEKYRKISIEYRRSI